MMVYDVCIVGAGMIGSATARHVCSMDPSLSVCLVGTTEPKSKSCYSDSSILGTHYDEGRLARQLYTHPSWAVISKRAAQDYRQLEKLSGIHFYEEVGTLTIMKKGSEYQNLHKVVADKVGINYDVLTEQESQDKFPYVSYNKGDEAWFEPKEAGYINPRKLVEAEQVVAKKHRCHIIDDVVHDVNKLSQPDGSTVMEISTASSGRILAKKVMLATGAFTEFQQLLPQKVIPDASIMSETVVLAELSEKDQKVMKNMPSMMYNGDSHEVEGRRYLYTYILPPIKYPDGKVYLKIGHMNIPDTHYYPTTLAEINKHFQSQGVEDAIRLLTKIMNKIFPGFVPKSLLSDTCVTTHTATGLPFIDLVHPQLGVAIAGNGAAGKACDELGKMAAMLILKGKWEYDLPKEWFTFRKRDSKGANHKVTTYAKL